MKKFLIILAIFIGVDSCLWLFRKFSPLQEQCKNQIPFKLDATTYFFISSALHDKMVKDFIGQGWLKSEYTGNISACYYSYYNFSYLKVDDNERKKAEQQLATYRDCKKQLKGKKPKVEILQVMRTASSFVMNNPSYFSRDISNNTITEKGKGADEEDIYVLYLSDGIVFKASPRDKPQWLGTKVGEKVRKVTSYEAVLHGNTYKVDTIVRYSPLYE